MLIDDRFSAVSYSLRRYQGWQGEAGKKMLFYETTLKSYELPLEVTKRAIRIRKNHYNLKE